MGRVGLVKTVTRMLCCVVLVFFIIKVTLQLAATRVKVCVGAPCALQLGLVLAGAHEAVACRRAPGART